MKKLGLTFLLAAAVFIAQAGAPLAQAMCQEKAAPCCCTPKKKTSKPSSTKNSESCPMMIQSSSSESAVLPSKFSFKINMTLVGIVELPSNTVATPSLKLALNHVLSPPGSSSHRLPSLRAPPALA